MGIKGRVFAVLSRVLTITPWASCRNPCGVQLQQQLWQEPMREQVDAFAKFIFTRVRKRCNEPEVRLKDGLVGVTSYTVQQVVA